MKKKPLFLGTLLALSCGLLATDLPTSVLSPQRSIQKRRAQSTRVVVEQPAPLFVNTSDVETVKAQLPVTLEVNIITIVDNEPVVEKDTAEVLWDAFSSTDLESNETLSLHGTVAYDGTNYDATIDITLHQIYKIVAPDHYVEVGTESYELPESVRAVYTDGYLEERTDITWIDSKPSAETKADYIVKGTVGGKEFEQKVVIYDETNAPSYNISFEATPTVNWDYTNDLNSDPAKIIDGSYAKAIDNWGPQQMYDGRQQLDTYEVYLTWDVQQTGINKIITHWLVEAANNSQIPLNLAVAYKANKDDADWIAIDAELDQDTSRPDDPKATFTFAPVNAQQVKVSWQHRKEVTGWGANPYDWTGITEFEAYSIDVPPTAKSSISSISTVNIAGTSVPNFQPTRFAYSVTIPYTAIEDPQFDIVLSHNKAQYVLIPGEVDGKPYRVVSIAENLTDYDIYTFYVTATKAPLERVELRLGDTANLVPGATLELDAEGTDAIGRKHGNDDARIQYSVNNLSGLAVVEGRTLKALRSGYVEVQATMTYGDSTLSSEKTTVLIQEGEALTVTSIERQEASTMAGVTPTLPQSAIVHFSDLTTCELEVTWEHIPSILYSNPGTFTVEGKVQGTDVPAQCVVTVLGTGSLSQELTISTVQGKVPSFPSTILSSMDTDFNTSESTLTIPDEYKNASLYTGEVGSIVDVQGTDGNGNPVVLHVQIVQGDTSKDYIENQNGYPNAPHTFAENTNVDETSMNFSNFADTDSYYVSKTEGTEAIVGFVMGDANIPGRIEINHLSFDLSTGEGLDDDIQVQAQQLNYDLSLATLGDNPDHYADISAATTDMLRKDANWSDLGGEPTVDGTTYSFDFDYASVSAVRFVITKDEGKAVKLNNIVGTTQLTTVSETLPELASLNVTIGEETTDLIKEQGTKSEYSIDYDGKSALDVSGTLASGERGSVYVLGNMGDNKIRVLVTSERGNLRKEITIHLNVATQSGIKVIGSLAQPAPMTVEKAEDFESSLPEQVEVTFTDGTTALVDVQFDTSVFAGKRGTYQLTGELVLPPEYVNAFEREVRLTVTVENDLEEEVPPVTEAHTVTINGADGVLPSTLSAEAGETVYLVAPASSEKEIASVTGVDNIVDYGNGTFSFVMPDEDVTLTVTLKDKTEEQPGLPEDHDDDKPTDPDDDPGDDKPTDPTTPEGKGGLQGGDIAAIILGVLLGLTIVGGIAYYFLVLKKK